MALQKLPSQSLLSESGTGAGTIIVWVGAFAVGTFIFYGVVDWIVAVKNDRAYERQAQSEANGPRKPFVPRDLQGTQLNY